MSQKTENTEEVILNPKLPRPAPPVIGKVTHHTIELYWDETLEKAMAAVEGRVRVCLQEKDKSGDWGNLYSGYAKRHTVSGLDPQTEYRYRMKFMNAAGSSEYSAQVQVATTKEPLNGEHLHKAIMRRDLELITKIVESGDVKIDVPDKFGFSGLMQASQKGYYDVAEVLLSHGADVGAQNDAGKTALMLACFAGQLDIVQLLRKHDADYDSYDKGGSSPIHWAVDGGNVKLLDWIIADGADVNKKDHSCGWTPLLRCASVGGNRDVALTLLMAGADINAQDRDGKTALMIGIINGHQPLVELLLKRNANLKVKNEYGKTAYEMAMAMEKRLIIRTLTEHMESKGIAITF